jgi:hypothetical protein
MPARFPSAIATAALLLGTPAAHAQWTMTNIHPAASTSSYAWAVSEGGITGYAYLPGRQSAGMWTSPAAASWIELSPPVTVSAISFGFAIGSSQQGGQWVPVGDAGGAGRACVWNGTAASFVDLHPPTGGYLRSAVLGIGAGRQWGWAQTSGFLQRASVWSGTAASRTELHPAGAQTSVIMCADGAHQGGYATFPASGNVGHAGMWSGTAASWADLHPSGASSSAIAGIEGSQQVGSAHVGTADHAFLWTGTAGSAVDLHPSGVGITSSTAYAIHGGVQVGNTTINGFTRASIWTGTAASREDPLPSLPVGTTQTEARGVYTTPTTITVVGMISRPGGSWNAVVWTKPNTAAGCGPADIGSAGGVAGPDGALNNNDFVVFIDWFFNHDTRADVGVTGGIAGHDNAWDNNDFVVFIDQFFSGTGC